MFMRFVQDVTRQGYSMAPTCVDAETGHPGPKPLDTPEGLVTEIQFGSAVRLPSPHREGRMLRNTVHVEHVE